MKRRIKIIVVLLLVSLVSFISGCGSKTKTINKSLVESSEEFVDINNKEEFKVGEYFQNEHFKVKVSKVDLNYKPKSEYDFPSEGNKFVKVIVEATNVGEIEDDISVAFFELYADDSMADGTMIVEDNYDDFGGLILPKKTTVGPLYYEVPKNAKTVILKYQPDVLNKDYKVEFKLN